MTTTVVYIPTEVKHFVPGEQVFVYAAPGARLRVPKGHDPTAYIRIQEATQLCRVLSVDIELRNGVVPVPVYELAVVDSHDPAFVGQKFTLRAYTGIVVSKNQARASYLGWICQIPEPETTKPGHAMTLIKPGKASEKAIFNIVGDVAIMGGSGQELLIAPEVFFDVDVVKKIYQTLSNIEYFSVYKHSELGNGISICYHRHSQLADFVVPFFSYS
jgi:hypothetical protein